MRFFEKHKSAVIIAGIALILLIVMGVSTLATGNAFLVDNLIGTIVQPVQKGISAVTDGIGGFFNFIFEMKDYKAENDRLSAQVAELEREYRSAESYRLENERLSALLDLKQNELGDKNTAAARVIGWSTDNWFDFYTLDKGSLDGVNNRNMVLTDEGLVGQVCEVGFNWSKVMTIIDPASSVGARVVRTGDVAMVEGDLELERQGLCKMTFINKDAQIVAGDILETSGLGGVFAPGVTIGRVTEVRTDEAGIEQYAVVEPMVDFKSMHHALIVLEETAAQ